MKTAIPVDVDVLRDEIQKTYSDVSSKPEEEFVFPTGRPRGRGPRLPRTRGERPSG
jgi:hypothetical protein